MKAEQLNFKKGQTLTVKIVEVVSLNSVIVEYRGTLFRVTNESGQILQTDQRLVLTVRSTAPLLFRIETGDKTHFDRFA